MSDAIMRDGAVVRFARGKVLWRVMHINADRTLNLSKVSSRGHQLIGYRYDIDPALVRPTEETP